MKVLFDENVDPDLAQRLPGHDCRTAEEMGWRSITNGELLKKADGEFDALITLDKGIRHQQNLSGLRIRLAVLRPGKPGLTHVLPLIPSLLEFLASAPEGAVLEIFPPT